MPAYAVWLFTTLFQSTLSMRRATARPRMAGAWLAISIHALHEESDSLRCPLSN